MDIENINKAGSLYKSVFELSQDSIVTLDTKGFITSINSAGAKILGYSVDELTGKHFAKIGYMNIRDIPKYIEIFTAAISGKDLKLLEINLTRKDGTPIVVEVRVGLLRENGKITGIQAITRDITERKKAEERIRRSEEKWSSLVENAPNIIIVVDREGTIQFINRPVSGFSREETVGKKIYDFINPEYHELARKTIEQVFKSGNTASYVIKAKGPQGRDSWYETLVGPIKRNGQVMTSILISTDITERKGAEEALRAAETRIRGLMNAVSVGISLSTTDGHLVEANDELWKMFGYRSREEYLKVPAIEHYFDTKDREILGELRKKGPVFDHEIRFKRKDGVVIWGSVNSIEEKSPDGKIYFVSSMLDVTERKKAEEKLRIKDWAIESSANAIVNSDIEGNLTYMNPAFLKLWGYSSPAEALGKPAVGFWQMGEKAAEAMEAVRKKGGWSGELVARRKDGTLFNVYVTSSMIVNDAGQPVCMQASFSDITERKEAETKLKDSEDRLKIIFESAPDAYYLNDLKGTFLDGNKAAEKVTGYKRDELIGKSFLTLKLLSPAQIPKAAALLARNLIGLSTGPDEFIMSKKDGTQVAVEISTHPVKIKGQTMVLGLARDITERKKAEGKIKESEARYGLIFNSATDLLAQMDMTGTIVDVNKQVLNIGGYERNEIVGKKVTTLARIFTVQSLALIAFNFAKVLAGQELKPYEVQAKNKAGQAIFFDVSSAIMRDPSGKAVGIIAILHDITERKKAEVLLRESEEKFKAIFDKANDGFLLASMKDKKFILGNKAICEMTGYTPEEIKTLGVMDIHPEKDLPYVIDQFEKQARKEITIAKDLPVKRKDGSVFYADINASPVTVLGEACLLGVFRDTTERKAAEALREDLLHKVEDANRKKTEYVSDVSHELRTPLASIKGFVSTIRSDKEMDEATRADFLRIIEEETDRLTRIIEDLLDISRIESGRLKLSMRSFNIMDLIIKNIENIKPQAGSKGIVIQSHPAPAPYIVYADQDKTSQIIINLLSNAIKYNKAGGKVSVAASDDNGKVRVDIEDTGIGISEKDLPHMFEKFFRAEGSSSETPGTGLGLAVTKSLVQVMGGEISVNSKPGEGSRFSFSLPKHAGDQKEKTNEFS